MPLNKVYTLIIILVFLLYGCSINENIINCNNAGDRDDTIICFFDNLAECNPAELTLDLEKEAIAPEGRFRYIISDERDCHVLVQNLDDVSFCDLDQGDKTDCFFKLDNFKNELNIYKNPDLDYVGITFYAMAMGYIFEDIECSGSLADKIQKCEEVQIGPLEDSRKPQ